jgi:hypothetical protein
MSPADLALEFLVRISAVVNHQIGALDQTEDIFVGLADDMLRVGDVTQRLAGIFNTIAGRPVGMVERGGAYLYLGVCR